MRSESGNSGANVPYPHSIIAKLYSNPDMAKYNLNSVHEFIGVFERSNADAAAADADSHEEEEEDVFGGLNDEERVFDAMPKLHVLYAREIDMNGDIKKEAAVATDLDTASSSLDKNQIKAVRENLVAALTSVLNGDQLSAEYLVCHIFARL